MKPLTPEQWTVLERMVSSRVALRNLSRRMARGFLECGNCKKREGLTSLLVEKYFREGWPICCETTAAGGTMNYYGSQAQLERELAITGGN